MQRQEQKFFLNLKEQISLLSKFKATVVYPTRRINSIYFDDLKMSCFINSEEGIIPRSKYRFRWYGNSFKIDNKGIIEIKKTFSNFKTKKSFNFNFNNLEDLSNAMRAKFNKNLIDICQVSYDRIYYANNDGVRFTYDFNIFYRSLKTNAIMKSKNTVFEIKYEGDDRGYFSSYFGDRMTRFSKYNEAVLKLRNQ